LNNSNGTSKELEKEILEPFKYINKKEKRAIKVSNLSLLSLDIEYDLLDMVH
jgi:hypothetical protein